MSNSATDARHGAPTDGRHPLRLSWNMVWLLIFFILCGIFLVCAPKYADDIWYLTRMGRWLTEHGVRSIDNTFFTIFGDFPWQQVHDTLEWRYYNDNIRLANVIGIFFLLLPKWVGSSVGLLALVYSVFKIFSLTQVNWRTSALVPVAIVALTFIAPWEHSLGSIIYQFNYLLPTAIALWLTGYLFRNKTGHPSFAGALAGGMLLGLWHEGFAVPLAGGLLFMAHLCRRCRHRAIYGAIIGLAAGTLILFSAPGMMHRGGSALGTLFSRDIYLPNLVTSFTVFGLASASYLLIRHRKITVSDDIACLCIISGVVSFLIQLLTDINCSRNGWWCHIMSVPVLLIVLDETGHDFWKSYNRRNICILVLPLALAYLYWANMDYLAIRMSASYRHIENEAYAGKRYVFSDVMPARELPPLKMRTNMGNLYDISGFLGDYYDYERDGDAEQLSIVSHELEQVTQNSGVEVPGGLGIRDYNGNLYMAYSDSLRIVDSQGEIHMQCDFGKGYVKTPFLCNSFISKGDGHRYLELRPLVKLYKSRFCRIKAINPDIDTQ